MVKSYGKMVKILIGIFIVFSLAFAKPEQTIEPIKASVYKNFDINTTLLKSKEGRVYKIFTATPKGLGKCKDAIFMLDGNAQFSKILNLYEEGAAKPTIVAIGYDTNLAYDKALRTKDYTPAASEEEYKEGGGAEEFYLFVKETLLPFVKEKFEIECDRKIFYGHSFGGLFTLFTLLKNDQIFDTFFIASPSLWWGESEFVKEALKSGKFKNLKASFIRLSVGELEKRKGKTDKEGILKAKDLAEILKDNGLNFEFVIYENHTHGSVINEVLKDILGFVK